LLLAVVLLVGWHWPAAADGGCAGLQLAKIVSPQAEMRGWFTVQVKGLASATGCNSAGFTLRLEGHEFAGLLVRSDPHGETVAFLIERQAADAAGWVPILGSPPLGGSRDVTVGVGPRGQSDFAYVGDTMPTVPFAIFSQTQLVVAILVAAALFVVQVWLAAATNLLRDPLPATLAAGQQRPFSLGRCQMAFWFVLLTVAFMGVWLITGDYNNILTSQSLILLGISGATALGAVSIDGSKASAAATKAAAGGPAAPTPPAHIGFLDDLLTDANGLVLQRLQVFVWTWVLGVISVVSIYRNLSLPAFDETLLTMTGISSGVYVGFKFPEKQS